MSEIIEFWTNFCWSAILRASELSGCAGPARKVAASTPHACCSKAALDANCKMVSFPAESKKPVVMKLQRVDLLALTNIDQINQSFTAQLYVQLRIPDGASDADLCSCLHEDRPPFPIGEDGLPTFRPSAGWYLNQFDFVNALDVHILDKAVMRSGPDLLLNTRYQGTFTEAFELENFPFDAQPLSISMVINCRESGPVPVSLRLEENLAKSVDPRKSFALYQQYHLADLINVRLGKTTTVSDRVFPTMAITFLVARRPAFVLTNVALPTLLISTLSFVPFMLHADVYIADRFALLFALVLTTVAFKSTIATMVPAIPSLTWVGTYIRTHTHAYTYIHTCMQVPAIPYLTWVDKYVLTNTWSEPRHHPWS